MAKYEITDETTYTKIVLYRGSPEVASVFWSIPKTDTHIKVQDGYLYVFSKRIEEEPLKIPRALITIPSSVSDEDLYNQLSFMSNDSSPLILYENEISYTFLSSPLTHTSFNPPGFTDADVILIHSPFTRNIAGMAAPAVGEKIVKVLMNSSGAYGIFIYHNSAAAILGERFSIGANLTIPVGRGYIFRYSHTLGAWQLMV